MKLEDLLARFEKTAADESEDKKDEKSGNQPPWLKDKKDGKDEKGESKSDEKDEDKEDKEDKDTEKKASVSPAASALAKEILEKVASSQVTQTTPATGQTNKETTEMKKQASEAGAALAQALLEKLAAAGDTNTVDGVSPGAVPNKQMLDTAQVIAEDDAKVKLMPGMGGTVNEIFDAVVADALAQGAAAHDQVHTQGVASVEGAAEEQATPNQEEVEKVAAVNALMADGMDLFAAVDLVKAAAEEIAREEETHVKQAALNSLIERGVDFDMAVALIRQGK